MRSISVDPRGGFTNAAHPSLTISLPVVTRLEGRVLLSGAARLGAIAEASTMTATRWSVAQPNYMTRPNGCPSA